MPVGWGIRSDYGHEAGAVIPGVLLALAVMTVASRDGPLPGHQQRFTRSAATVSP